MKKKAKKHKADPHNFGYSFLRRMASRKRRQFTLSLEEYIALKTKGCYNCKKSIPVKTVGVELIVKSGNLTKDNIRVICGVCKASRNAKEFDYIKYSINQLRRGWKKTPHALLAVASAKNEDGEIQCVQCKEWFSQSNTHLDHVNPAIDPVQGFISLDLFAKRLLDNPPLQNLCIDCHSAKTIQERAIRKQSGSIKAGKKRKQEQRK